MKGIVENKIDQIRIAALEVVRLNEAKFDAEKASRDFVEGTVTALIGKPEGADGKKVYSLNSAEAYAKKTDEYRAMRETVQEAENALMVANASYEMTRLRARLAVSLVAVGEPE